jgi:hypothetical protein
MALAARSEAYAGGPRPGLLSFAWYRPAVKRGIGGAVASVMWPVFAAGFDVPAWARGRCNRYCPGPYGAHSLHEYAHVWAASNASSGAMSGPLVSGIYGGG